MGHVGVCIDCGSYQLSFGNILLYFNEKALRRFVWALKKIDTSFIFKMPEGEKVLLTTQCQGVIMTLNESDLDDLILLVEEAIISLEINKVLIE
jgi:hypothetical protein